MLFEALNILFISDLLFNIAILLSAFLQEFGSRWNFVELPCYVKAIIVYL